MSTTKYTIDLLNSRHPSHDRLRKRWKFLHDSFMGGDEYRQGDYLTRYVYETEVEYENRKREVPLDNHCKNIIHTYTSYLFQNHPHREFENLERDPGLELFLEDADLDGRDFNHFMRDANTMSSVFGTSWIIVDKPDQQFETRAQEFTHGIRPYVSLINPINVVNWEYTRAVNGGYQLSYLQIFERAVSNTEVMYRVYTPESTDLIRVNGSTVEVVESVPQALGYIPAVICYNSRSFIQGIGVSDIADIADQQLKIANLNSELVQLARISNHPSLVKTEQVIASAGAGSVITVPENTPDGLKPYLLQPDSSNIQGLLDSINQTVETIDKLAHLGGIRNTASRSSSGVALQTEFTLLQSKLSEKARSLEHTEEQIWQIWAEWQDQDWRGEIEYNKNYNVRDEQSELEQIKLVRDMQITTSPLLNSRLEMLVAEMFVEDPDTLAEIKQEIISQSRTQIDELQQIPDSDVSVPGVPSDASEPG